MSIKATTDTGITGFIIAGHVVNDLGTTGDPVFQPSSPSPPSSDQVGTVLRNPKLKGNTNSADAAFVSLSSGITIEDKIYKASNSAYSVIGKLGVIYTPPSTSLKIISPYTSGEKSGQVSATGVTVSDTHGTLTNQVKYTLTGYTTVDGDSGAPIYSPPNANNQVNFYGIHVGKFNTGSEIITVYSPWEDGNTKGIKHHLSLSS